MWMYDQIFANSELDFVTDLRKEGGDEFAVATMRNHWSGYITDDQLDAAKRLGVDTVRVPVGYWIMDAPTFPLDSTPLDYGISPEGFVTGGLNHLKDMLVALKQRDMVALVDIHAMPCNSACVSDGLYCALPLAFAPPGFAPIGDMKRCGGGTYPTTRVPTKGEKDWSDVRVATRTEPPRRPRRVHATAVPPSPRHAVHGWWWRWLVPRGRWASTTSSSSPSGSPSCPRRRRPSPPSSSPTSPCSAR